jgi:hypothetical protein
MNLNDVAEALAAAIATATGFRCYDHTPPNPNIPSLWIQPPDDIDYQVSFGRDSMEATFVVSSAVKGWDEEKGQTDLRTLLTSIRAAFDTDNTLNGTCSRAKLITAELVSTQVGGTPYLGYDFTVQILG